jgi:Nickel responsive protein SCO4226-like
METVMARFMDVHSGFIGVTEKELQEAHGRDLAVEDEEGVHYERAWLDPVSGKVFCLASGPSKEAVMRVHERAGHPTTEVYELSVEVA